MINEKKIAQRLRHNIDITVFDELDSTNLEARRIADSGDLTPRVIIAARQSAGRGRLTRSFFSPSGGVYMSILIKPDMPSGDAIMLTTASAVAAARAADRLTGRKCGIKWVNDLYLDGRKVCGILTEAKFEGERMAYAVVGIGVNLTMPTNGFPEDIRARAGALYDYGCAPEDAENILASEIINNFLDLLGAPRGSYLNEYRERSIVLGREVDVISVIDGHSRRAIATAIDDECRLMVKYPDGSEDLLSTGEISLHI